MGVFKLPGALTPVQVPISIWERTDVLQVLARRDIGQLFRIVQKSTGATQTQLGTTMGLSQAQVSEIISGARKVTTIDVLARVVKGLDIPPHVRAVLFMGELPSAAELTMPAQPRSSSGRFADVVAIFNTRSAFASAYPVHDLFDNARRIRALGLSLNLICQQYSDSSLLSLATQSTSLQLLLLDPDGEAIRHREKEEHYQPRYLSALNELNLGVLRRVYSRIPHDAQENLCIAVYDQTIRFNIILIDDRLCIVQPYLPHSRGVESPTFVIERHGVSSGLYETFEQVFTATWEGARRCEQL